jgi:hypothetical protein
MKDFLDNLIERHMDAAPQIVPRLPSIFEPEVPHTELDVADLRTEETEIPSSAQITIPTASPTAIEPMQQKAAPAPTAPAREGKPSVKAGLHESVFSLSPREIPTLAPFSQGGGEEGIRGERGLNEVIGRVRLAHHKEHTDHAPLNPKVTAEDQSPVKEDLSKPSFSLSPRETPTLPPPSQGGSEEGVRGRNQGLLKPSATLIAPVIPSPAGPKRPISQPEPVINVTIGRIEVRATPASAQPVQKPRSTPPVMTLDEYLRKRSKGDR